MNSLILCTAATLNIFSAPAGNTVVGGGPGLSAGLSDGGQLDARLGLYREARRERRFATRLGDLRRPRTVSVMASNPLCDVQTFKSPYDNVAPVGA